MKDLVQQDYALLIVKDLGMIEMPSIRKDTGARNKTRQAIFKCKCETEFQAQTAHVKSGNTLSCGCVQKQRAGDSVRKHGLTQSSEYRTWSEMKARCTRVSHKDYLNYGDRGITVCDRWLESFENFLEDMGRRPKGLELDRKDNNGNYTPENCRWVPRKINVRNSRRLRNKTGYRGITEMYTDKAKTNLKFNASICVDYVTINLGYYDSKEEAAIAYNTYIIDNNLEHLQNEIY